MRNLYERGERSDHMKFVPAIWAAVILVCVWETGSIARAQQTYMVAGRDRFTIGSGDIQSDISYAGTQTLSVTKNGKVTRLTAHVTYSRSDGTASTDASGDYIADQLPTGETLDSADHDPDYLTVLNQPFAAQLDRQTLADLEHLTGVLPFDFPSPFTGSSLHGYLEHVGGGMLGRRRSTGVKFEAAGPMKGQLPDRPGLTLTGSIAMRGTAFYDLDSSLLLELDTTVTIRGTVSNRSGNDPVTITYTRTIRSQAPAPAPVPSVPPQAAR
jgi:hypothetical protein